ncbi:MraY family glycosyltransferase [Streptomyces sp. NPDC004610]|uniref:MraY family glycosyltransferase n=1 Tax=unclassified Streptomyces TaxID=2593676 RepID=UPI0033A91A15
MLYGIAAALAALLLAALLSALLGALALRRGLLDRRRRTRPVPLLGGGAVVGATLLVAGAGEWAGVARLGDGVGALLTAATAVAALGLAADLWRLRTRFLLAGTVLAALWVVLPYGGGGGGGGGVVGGVVGAVVAACWMAGVALAFRSLDHADALAGTVGVVTAFGLGVCAAVEVRDGLAVLLSVLAAALTGFLMHNWPPARITLGATGSLFVGFVLAGAALLTRAGGEVPVSFGVLFAVTAVAVADVALVLLARRLAGRALAARGGPDHLAHRLRRAGLTARGAAVTLGTGSFAAVLVGVLVHTGWTDAWAVLWVAGGVVVMVGGLLRVGGGGSGERGRAGGATSVGRGRGRDGGAASGGCVRGGGATPGGRLRLRASPSAGVSG